MSKRLLQEPVPLTASVRGHSQRQETANTLLQGKIRRSRDHQGNQERGNDYGRNEPSCSCLPAKFSGQAMVPNNFR
jgi:hypothetical protein